MKNLLYLIMASTFLMVCGCVKEKANDQGQSEQKPALDIPMKTVTLDASMINIVKSTVDEEGQFGWTSDDAIAVNVEYRDNEDALVNAFFEFDVKEISSEDNKIATFEGMIPETGVLKGVAVYPYNTGHVYSGGNLSVDFPSQVSENNHLPAMYAKIEGGTLQFNHLSSMLRLTYRYVPKGTDGMILTSTAVAGLYNVNIETGDITATQSVSDQVKVSFDALTTMQEEKAIYVPVPAGERTIAAHLTKGEEMVTWSSISSKSAREFEVGNLYLLPSYNVHFSELYILGGPEDTYAWERGDMVPMEESEDHIFTWTGRLFKGNSSSERFRFPVETAYYPAIYKVDDTPTVKFENMGNSYDFTVDRDGYYAVTVNATDMDNITVNVEFRYPTLFIVGYGTRWGYEKNSPAEGQWLTMTSDGVYEWTGWLTDDYTENDGITKGAFKFLAQKGEWLPSYNREEGEDWTLVERTASNGVADKKFTINRDGYGDGIYTLTVNLNTMTVNAVKTESTEDLYVIGRSVDDSFKKEPTTAYKMTYEGNGVYTWSGTMKVDTENGFKIIAWGAWTPLWGPDYDGKISNASIGDGAALWNNTDRKWDLKSSEGYSEGTYKIVLDTSNKPNGTISVTPIWSDPTASQLKVMSYNIRYGSADDGSNSWENRRPATIAMINDLQPDVFGVQEALSDQLEYVTSNCSDYSMVGVGRDDGQSAGEHMSVFWNTRTMKMLEWGTFWLSDTPDVPSGTWGSGIRRSTTWTLMQQRESGRKFFFVNTHLHHRVNEYEAQKKGLQLILERVGQMNTGDYPVILTGDFNIEPDNSALDVLDGVMLSARENAQKTDHHITFNDFSSTGGQILDYIYYSGFSGCLEYRTVTTTYLDIPYVSDHYPVISRLVF